MSSEHPTKIYENDADDEVFVADGAYSKIYDRGNQNQRIITKKIDRHQTTSLNRQNHVRREVIVMKKMDHQNCVRFIEYSDQNENYHQIKMEKCPGQNLYTILTKKLVPQHLIPYFQVKVCLDCISALNAVRQKMIMNRDIKCSNIVVNITPDNQVTVKMIDFGQSRFAIHDAVSVVGTYGYMAPQVYFGKKIYTDICDCWSLGVVLYQIFSYKDHSELGLCFPFRGKFIPKIVEHFNEIYEKHIWQDGISLNIKEVQQPFRIVIRGLLNPDPSKRMDLVQATWILFQQFDKIKDVLHSQQQKDIECKRLYQCHIFQKFSAFRKESIKSKLEDLSVLYKDIYQKIIILIPKEDFSQFTLLIKLVLNVSKKITQTMQIIIEKMEQKVSTLKKRWTNQLHQIFLPVITCKQYLKVFDKEQTFLNYLQRKDIQLGKILKIEDPIKRLIIKEYPNDGAKIIAHIHRLLKVSQH